MSKLMSLDFKPSTVNFENLDLATNLNVFGAFLTNSYAKAVGDSVQLVLRRATPRVPVESGELRESGTAVVRFRGARNYAMLVGTGKADGSISERDTSRLSKIGREGRIKKHGITHIIGNVLFQKINEFGEDVALWAHEDLLPYTSRTSPPTGPPPSISIKEAESLNMLLAARTPGTGPKYLELAYLESKDEIVSILRNAVSIRNLKSYIKSTGKK
jgi:hypothetical protein